MEREKLRSNALENEIELGAVAEAQVAQAEGLLQVVDAITQAQTRFTKAVVWACALCVSISIIGICGFMHWQTQNIRETAEIALPAIKKAKSSGKFPSQRFKTIRDSRLVHRLSRNSTRPFADWHPADAEAAVAEALSEPDGHTRLVWITSQADWATILSWPTVVKVQIKLQEVTGISN